MDNQATGEWPIKIKCKDCGRTFEVSHDEALWLEEHKLSLYRRCQLCRAARRMRKGTGA